MNDRHTQSLVPIENKPVRPPRAGCPEEGVFLAAWQQFAERVPEEFAAVFHHAYREWSQPMASAAASFATWLGTNCGNSFLLECKRRSESERGRGAEASYIAQWGIENERVRWVNHGLRCVEFMLAETYPITDAPFTVDWNLVPEISMEQQDAIECVVRWLASSQGRSYVEVCEARIAADRRAKRLFEIAPADGVQGSKNG